MKRNDFNQIKMLTVVELLSKVKAIKGDLDSLTLDKNMKKLKNTKAISNKRVEIAQILTVINQKQMLEKLQNSGQVTANSEQSEVKTQKEKVKSTSKKEKVEKKGAN